MKKIELLKKGEFFKRKDGANKTYVRGEYSRPAKAYECHDFDDVNSFIYIKKGKDVFIEFEF